MFEKQHTHDVSNIMAEITILLHQRQYLWQQNHAVNSKEVSANLLPNENKQQQNKSKKSQRN